MSRATKTFFCRLYSQFMGCLVRSPKSYLLLWFGSWLWKWKNRFRTLRVGLAAGLQSRSRGCTPGWSRYLGFQVPYGPSNKNMPPPWSKENFYLFIHVPLRITANSIHRYFTSVHHILSSSYRHLMSTSAPPQRSCLVVVSACDSL